MRTPGIFAFMGFLAGVISLAIASRWPEFLTFGVGALFLVALILGIHLTEGWSLVASERWRRIGAAIVFAATYPLAVFAFVIAEGFSSQLLRFSPSATITNFGLDVWIGFGVSVLLTASGIQLATKLLFRNVNIVSFGLLLAVGFLTVCVTKMSSLAWPNSWGFWTGILLFGDASFCMVFGLQMRRIASDGRGGSRFSRP